MCKPKKSFEIITKRSKRTEFNRDNFNNVTETVFKQAMNNCSAVIMSKNKTIIQMQ